MASAQLDSQIHDLSFLTTLLLPFQRFNRIFLIESTRSEPGQSPLPSSVLIFIVISSSSIAAASVRQEIDRRWIEEFLTFFVGSHVE